MIANEPNPLLIAQREKAGAETASDYAYQYHWALYRAIQEHKKNREYAIFVELHEDVVISDSLTGKEAKFEFNQVKTTKRTFTENELCKLKNGSSVLGKLIDGTSKKPFSSQISTINLVALHGFGLKLKEEGLVLQIIRLSDLADSTIASLAEKINSELGLEELPINLQFVIPDLVDNKFQNDVIAEISKLIVELFPGSNYNSIDIYRLLIDELNRKGMVTYDYTKWDDLLKNKALTSETVQKVINEFTSIKNEAKIEAEFNSIIEELGLKVIERRELKKNFDRYRQGRIGNKSGRQLDLSKSIVGLLRNGIADANGDIMVLILHVAEMLDQQVRSNFHNESQLHAAIICEFILEEI